jgi:sialate O-acetylesterase
LARAGTRKPLPPRTAAHRDAPASLFNGMIYPLVPYAIAGMIWDQGAANEARANEYAALFKALIVDWRNRWGRPDRPFHFVQAPNYRDPFSPGDYRARLREAQAAAAELSDVGMAVTVDIGDPTNPHPHNKAEVGRRLSLLARAHPYGETLVTRGPIMHAVQKTGSELVVEFETSGRALQARAQPLSGFEIADASQHFVPALARIEGRNVRLTHPDVHEPVSVRYAWGDDPDCGLSNDLGLPAAPFRTSVR